MLKHLRWLMPAVALVVVLVVPRAASAQADPTYFKFNSGQGMQPIFEGWAKNADGSFSMYFGYINRNYVEELLLPVGPENNIQPGGPDRGQPTFFYPRIRRKAFSLTVPKDWGQREVVWSLTVRGKTEKAIGWMQPEWEIDPIYAGQALSPEKLKNKPPAMTVDAVLAVTLPSTLTLTATVIDDGLPVPRKDPPKQATGQETPPTLKPLPDAPEVPVNVPQIPADSARGGGGRNAPKGLLVTWIVWRGPAAVTFDPPAAFEVKDAKAVVTAKFTKAGTYVLRGRANDGALWDEKDVTVTVNGPSQ